MFHRGDTERQRHREKKSKLKKHERNENIGRVCLFSLEKDRDMPGNPSRCRRIIR
jgi:hypothetical protein